jgi:phosphohistidine phosphatase
LPAPPGAANEAGRKGASLSMKIVTLFRHAKSGEKNNPNIADFDRPLSAKGIKTAPKMGEAIREFELVPDLILCSPSARTRQTLELAAARAWDRHPDTRFENRLYEASAQTLLKALKELPSAVTHIMAVGHNPGMQDLAVKLSSRGSEIRRQLAGGLPTAAIVSYGFEIGGWEELKPGTGQLRLSLTPNTLPG